MEIHIMQAGLRVPRAAGITRLLLLSLAVNAGVMAWYPGAFAAASAATPDARTPADDAEPAPGRACPQCAVVIATRELSRPGECLHPAATRRAARHEVTVRMRDGSTRILAPTSAGVWRVGERLMLIGGDVAGPQSPTIAGNAR